MSLIFKNILLSYSRPVKKLIVMASDLFCLFLAMLLALFISDIQFNSISAGQFFNLLWTPLICSFTFWYFGVYSSVVRYIDLSVILILIILINKYNLNFETQNLKIIFSVLLVLFAFNFFEKFFCGDGGSYVISLIVGYYLILLSNLDLIISPYFIACLLWYPAYECLFSMIRKKIKKYQITSPDNRHLHQCRS